MCIIATWFKTFSTIQYTKHLNETKYSSSWSINWNLNLFKFISYFKLNWVAIKKYKIWKYKTFFYNVLCMFIWNACYTLYSFFVKIYFSNILYSVFYTGTKNIILYMSSKCQVTVIKQSLTVGYNFLLNNI